MPLCTYWCTKHSGTAPKRNAYVSVCDSSQTAPHSRANKRFTTSCSLRAVDDVLYDEEEQCLALHPKFEMSNLTAERKVISTDCWLGKDRRIECGWWSLLRGACFYCLLLVTIPFGKGRHSCAGLAHNTRIMTTANETITSTYRSQASGYYRVPCAWNVGQESCIPFILTLIESGSFQTQKLGVIFMCE